MQKCSCSEMTSQLQRELGMHTRLWTGQRIPLSLLPGLSTLHTRAFVMMTINSRRAVGRAWGARWSSTGRATPSDEAVQLSYFHTQALVMMPINNHKSAVEMGGSHWSLLVYDRTSNTFMLYDSMLEYNKNAALVAMKQISLALGEPSGMLYVRGMCARTCGCLCVFVPLCIDGTICVSSTSVSVQVFVTFFARVCVRDSCATTGAVSSLLKKDKHAFRAWDTSNPRIHTRVCVRVCVCMSCLCVM